MYPGRRRRKSGSPPAEVPFEKMTEAFEWAKQGFNSSLHTKVLIHGFGSDCSYIWVYEIRSALMAVEEVNIICVDWSDGATLPNYVKASANTRLVGKQLSLLLRGLVEKNGLSLKKTHLIGFSLGAHIAAFAGADLGNLSRITGLDPAGPLFESQDPRARLDQTDADFVDVIHSNGENLILGGLGSSQPMGHVDFYPNGGRMQKGCSHLFVGAVSDIIWSSPVEGRSLCNHRRAYKFFIDSVSPRCHFPAFPCDSYEEFLDGKCFPCTDERKCGNMGYYADRSKGRGQLYLITRDEEPFCAHQYHVKLETTSSPIPVKSYGKIQITLIGENGLNETFTMTRKDDEEMKLGQSISRILVPHPILSQLTKVEILYTAYSGWLSSGLTQWKMDKVTLMDSFGKTSSVCKKNLILESGTPVILPLYPGECNLPKNTDDEAEDRIENADDTKPFNFTDKKPEFIPTQVVRVGLEDKYLKLDQSVASSEPIDFYNLPWTDEKENDLIDEAESSRAFNTRVTKPGRFDEADKNGLLREIVEPILKPQSSKNARSHDPDKEKPEITEPILGPTTTKNLSKLTKTLEIELKSKDGQTSKDPKLAFYDASDSIDWVPKDFSAKPKLETKRKREDESRILNVVSHSNRNDPIETIATTVQFLPKRIARMFEEAEKYARENLFPLVSTYTPRFISDIIVPKPSKPKYIPLKYKEDTNKESTSAKPEKVAEKGREMGHPSPVLPESAKNDVTTPFTFIQKIKRRGDKTQEDLLVPVTKVIAQYKQEENGLQATTPTPKQVTRKARDDLNVSGVSKKVDSFSDHVANSSRPDPRAIYIDLPVFEKDANKIKYIPLLN
nr:uncharacterized protein LOC111509893 [Leptinotarsa decemlineata]